jgi:hypothetical protein
VIIYKINDEYDNENIIFVETVDKFCAMVYEKTGGFAMQYVKK